MIKILIDSASDIDLSEARELGIEMIPMTIQFGDETYQDGIDLGHKEFFEKLIENNDFPKTSQINEYSFTQKFAEMTANGDEVIAITISSKLSGTYHSAIDAAKQFVGKVHVVDSLNVCIGERILCQYAMSLVKRGKLSADEIVSELENKKTKIKLLAVLDTLVYLRKGGRISSVTAIAGEMLSIKPVISIVDGEVKVVGKAIGSKKGNNLLNQLVDRCGVDFSMPCALAYSGLSDNYLQKYLHDSESLWKGKIDYIPSYMIGSTIGTHSGPNAIAVAFFGEK